MLTRDCHDGEMQDLSHTSGPSVDSECMVQVANLRNRTSIFAVDNWCRLNLWRYGGVLFAKSAADCARFLSRIATFVLRVKLGLMDTSTLERTLGTISYIVSRTSRLFTFDKASVSTQLMSWHVVYTHSALCMLSYQ